MEVPTTAHTRTDATMIHTTQLAHTLSTLASLNISTYIALYGYGYKNVYELGPLLDPAKTKIERVSTTN
jgi:hypothetical protein